MHEPNDDQSQKEQKQVFDAMSDAITQQQETQRQSARGAIKALYASAPLPLSSLAVPINELPVGRVLRGDDLRLTPGGRVLGWYRPSQRVGMPSRKSATILATERYLQDLCLAIVYFGKVPSKRELGKLSGAARREKSTALKIIAYWISANEKGQHRRGLTKKLAREFNCSVDYVRKVIRRYQKGYFSSTQIEKNKH